MAQVDIKLRGTSSNPALEACIRHWSQKLFEIDARLEACHVTVDVPHRSSHHPRQHHVVIRLAVPGGHLVSTWEPAPRERSHLFAAVHAAFQTARRQLDEYLRRHTLAEARREAA